MPNGEQSEATAINDAGRIAGTVFTEATNETGPYVTSQAAVVFDCGLPRHLIPGTNFTSASGINNWGEIVGGHSVPNSLGHAFSYRNGSVTDLGTLGGNFSAAFGVNNRGDIVGGSTLGYLTPLHPFLYSHGLMRDLGTLGGSMSMAYAINDNGEIVGFSNTT